jgi:hypothetical protein
LGLAVCAELPPGWAAGFLAEDYDIEQLETLISVPVPPLVVIDYAETRAPQVEQLLTLALEAATVDGPAFRVLFLVRHGRVRADGRLDLGAGVGEWTQVLVHNAPPPLLLDDLALSVDDRQRLFSIAVEIFGGQPAPVPDVAHPTFEVPLMVLIAAFLGAQTSRETTPDRDALLDAILGHERRYWDNTPDRDYDLGCKVLAVTALCPVAGEDQTAVLLGELLTELSGDPGPRYRWPRWAQHNYPSRDQARHWVAPLEPDLLAEHLIAQHLLPPTWTVASRSDLVLYFAVADMDPEHWAKKRHISRSLHNMVIAYRDGAV